MRPAVLVALAIVACNKPPAQPSTQPSTAARVAVFEKENPRRDLFEGAAFKNGCGGDADCKVGGCSGEVCTAEEGVNTACIVLEDQPRDASCGCVHDECVWYRAAGKTPPPSTTPTPPDATPTTALPPQGSPCTPDGKCADNLSCVSYYGIAGARGPKFTSCEIPCSIGRCPDGQTCITIADGPGRVCRPR